MPPRDQRTVLYRFFGPRDVLLYVGITSEPGRRWDEHVKSTVWWRKVRRQTAEWYDSRDAAEEAERRAIETEQPVYNVVHSSKAPEPLSATEMRLLMYDLDAVLGVERIRIAELPARLRFFAPGIPLYQKLNGVRLLAALRQAGIRTTNQGNVPRLDPADLRQVAARKAG